jgi:3',5'-cyclic AMP phosphodiesterase CpdA
MRIAALSDQHGFLPDVPDCDLLIVAGDVCPDRFGPHFAGSHPEFQKDWFDRKARPWLAGARARHRLLTWGNHDWCGERCGFDEDAPGTASSEVLQILNAQSSDVEVGGERLHVWGSPWSKQFGFWAFMRPDAELAPIYAGIPAGVDILVSHQPPYGYGDEVPDFMSGKLRHEGSRQLLAAIDRVQPKVVICGHIHEGHGRTEHNGTQIYNVSVVDEQYRLVHPVTVIEV